MTENDNLIERELAAFVLCFKHYKTLEPKMRELTDELVELMTRDDIDADEWRATMFTLREIFYTKNTRWLGK